VVVAHSCRLEDYRLGAEGNEGGCGEGSNLDCGRHE
jgi:hypothetical protein